MVLKAEKRSCCSTRGSWISKKKTTEELNFRSKFESKAHTATRRETWKCSLRTAWTIAGGHFSIIRIIMICCCSILLIQFACHCSERIGCSSRVLAFDGDSKARVMHTLHLELCTLRSTPWTSSMPKFKLVTYRLQSVWQASTQSKTLPGTLSRSFTETVPVNSFKVSAQSVPLKCSLLFTNGSNQS